jgi:3-oxoacyl-[acyl-carrier protein] reductase
MAAKAETSAVQTAVVTGGSRGIGRAIVSALAEVGWRVFYCSRNAESIAEAQTALARFAPRVVGRPVDVRDERAVGRFVGEVLADGGRIDCLVNNAGIGKFGAVDSLTGEQWREVIETNLHGTFYAMRAVAPAMRQQGSGWIINIASLAARNAFAGGSAYNASKFGLLGLTEAAMLDLRQDGVRVAAVLPGSVDTGFRSGSEPASWMLAPEDVAATVLHLLSYPPRALPSLVEIRPSRPPSR